MDQNIVEFAKVLRERDNIIHSGIQIGKVETLLPDIKIRLSDEILLNKSHLVFAEHTLPDYQRTFESDGQITTSTTESFTSSGNITFTDTFSIGDELILMPTQNEQTFFVLGKAVRL